MRQNEECFPKLAFRIILQAYYCFSSTVITVYILHSSFGYQTFLQHPVIMSNIKKYIVKVGMFGEFGRRFNIEFWNTPSPNKIDTFDELKSIASAAGARQA